MKTKRVFLSIVTASVCALALAAMVGCAASSSSSSASASSAASSSSSASASASASSSSAASSSATSQQASSAASSAGQLTAESAAAQGYQVFSGTVRVLSAEELIKLQGSNIDPRIVSNGGTYAVLVFDQETQVSGMLADGSGENTRAATMLGIAEHTDYDSFVVEYGDLDYCKTLDGQHVTMGAKAQDIMFPTDVRLPMGQPSASSVVLLA